MAELWRVPSSTLHNPEVRLLAFCVAGTPCGIAAKSWGAALYPLGRGRRWHSAVRRPKSGGHSHRSCTVPAAKLKDVKCALACRRHDSFT